MCVSALDFHREEDEWDFWKEKKSEEDMDTLGEKLDFLLSCPEKPVNSEFPNILCWEDK